MTQTRALASLAAASLFATAAHAGVTVTIAEVGSDVFVTAVGDFDLEMWENLGTVGGDISAEVSSSHVFLGADAVNTDFYAAPDDFSGPDSIAMGFTTTALGSGTSLGFLASGALYLPDGIDPGDGVLVSDIYSNESFDSMGLTAGSTFTWTWATKADEDFFTIVVAPAPGACLAAALAGMVAMRRRR